MMSRWVESIEVDLELLCKNKLLKMRLTFLAHRGLFERFELGERLPLLLEDPSDGDNELSESTSPVVVEFPFILAVKLD